MPVMRDIANKIVMKDGQRYDKKYQDNFASLDGQKLFVVYGFRNEEGRKVLEIREMRFVR